MPCPSFLLIIVLLLLGNTVLFSAFEGFFSAFVDMPLADILLPPFAPVVGFELGIIFCDLPNTSAARIQNSNNVSKVPHNTNAML